MVYFGRTPWGEDVRVPLMDLVRAVGLVTGGMGAGKTMASLLMLERLVRLLPQSRTLAFGVIDPKGELFDRALWLLAWRANAPRRLSVGLLLVRFCGSILSASVCRKCASRRPACPLKVLNR